MSVASASRAWSDQFVKPGVEDLLAGLNRAEQGLITRSLESLEELGAGQRSVQWHGVPWNWAIATRCEHEQLPVAFVVPQPKRPQIAVPIPGSCVTKLPLRKLSKPTREGLVAAKVVDRVFWPEWDLTSKGQIEEIMQLVAARLEASVVRPAGT